MVPASFPLILWKQSAEFRKEHVHIDTLPIDGLLKSEKGLRQLQVWPTLGLAPSYGMIQ